MATQANAATEKDATPTASPASSRRRGISLLRASAPQIRTAAAIIEKHEQIQDALEHESITGKVAEQMNQTLKGIMGVARLELQFFNMLLKAGRKAPVPRSPLLRNVAGLPDEANAKDGEQLRALIAEH